MEEIPSHVKALATHAQLLKESSEKHLEAGHDFTASQEMERYDGLMSKLRDLGFEPKVETEQE